MSTALEPTEPPETDPRRRRVTIGRVLALVVFVAFTIMWTYVFVNQGKYKPAGWLKDRRFPTAAEPICKASRYSSDRSLLSAWREGEAPRTGCTVPVGRVPTRWAPHEVVCDPARR